MATQALNCTQCGAPLAHTGGRKISSITCQYCNAEHQLAGNEQLKFLSKLSQHSDHLELIPLGTKCTLKGLKFVVIGMLEYYSHGETWQEYSLYSETHGYATLSHTTGHFTFSRRIRNVQDETEYLIHDGTTYLHTESYNTKLLYVAGELTWEAKLGDATRIHEYQRDNILISCEENGLETEYHIEEYVPNNVIQAAFGWNEPPIQYGKHPLERWEAPAWLAPLLKPSRWGMLIAVILYLLAAFVFSSTKMKVVVSPKTVVAQHYSSAPSNDIRKDNYYLIPLDRAQVGNNVELIFTGRVATALLHIDFVVGAMDDLPKLVDSNKKLKITNNVTHINTLLFNRGYSSHNHQNQVEVSVKLPIAEHPKQALGIFLPKTVNKTNSTSSIRLTVKQYNQSQPIKWLFFFFFLPTLIAWVMKISITMSRPVQPPKTVSTWGHD